MTHRDSSRPPLRLALVITELDLGGAEKCLVELASRLDRNRFLPTVYSLAAIPEGPHADLPQQLAAEGISVQSLEATSPRHFGRAIYRLRRHFRQQPPDLVQTFLFHANVIGAIAARIAGIDPVIAGIRVADLRSPRRLAWERCLTRNVARYVCVSHDVAEFSAAQGGLPRSKLTVIPNGVDVDRFANASPLSLASLGMKPGQRALLAIGRLDPQKRIDRLLSLFDLIHEQLPHHDLIIVGEGPERARLEHLASTRSLSARVHFLGQRNDIPQILAASDLLLLTSDFEGMPNVALEAMAAGKPVVSTDVTGMREMLGPTAEDQVVPWCDDDEEDLIANLARRTVGIANNEFHSSDIGKKNQRRARQEFSYEAMVCAYQDLFEQVVTQEARP